MRRGLHPVRLDAVDWHPVEERTTVDVWDLSRVLLRRWYVFVPLVLMAAGAVTWVLMTARPDYVATTHVQMLPPPKITVGAVTRDPVNPYLGSGSGTGGGLAAGVGSLGDLARVSLDGESVATSLVAGGFTDAFTITVDPVSSLVTIETVGVTERQATGTATQLAMLFMQTVADLQTTRGVGQDDLILARRVGSGDRVLARSTKVGRAVAAVGVVGLLFAVGVTVGVDGAAHRRRNRAAWAQMTGATPEYGPGAGHPGSVYGSGSGRRFGRGSVRRGFGARDMSGGLQGGGLQNGGLQAGGLRGGGIGAGGLRGGGPGGGALGGPDPGRDGVPGDQPGSGAGGPRTPVFTVGGITPALTSGRPAGREPDGGGSEIDGNQEVSVEYRGYRSTAPRADDRDDENPPRQPGGRTPEPIAGSDSGQLPSDDSAVLLRLSQPGRPEAGKRRGGGPR
jgi:hypothetical protein